MSDRALYEVTEGNPPAVIVGDDYMLSMVEPDLVLRLHDTGPRWSKMASLPAGTYAIVIVGAADE